MGSRPGQDSALKEPLEQQAASARSGRSSET